MAQRFIAIVAGVLLCGTILADENHGVVVGTIVKMDSGAKTAVVKTAEGSEHTVHFVKRTSVHGAEAVDRGAKDAFHGLKEGSEVAVHYTANGTLKTAEEVDRVGKDGLKASEVTVTHVDRGAKTMAVKTADGAEETYHLTTTAAADAGKGVAKGTEKGAKATVYYTEEGGRKVVHFFKRAM